MVINLIKGIMAKAKKRKAKKKVVIVDCPDCVFKRGLLNETTICPTCEGSGKIEK